MKTTGATRLPFKLCLLLLALIAIHACSPGSPVGEAVQDFSETRLGLQPPPGDTVHVSPPYLAWGPLDGETSYRVEISRDSSFSSVETASEPTPYCVWRPSAVLDPGQWFWRVSGVTEGRSGRVYSFVVAGQPIAFPAPDYESLLSKIPSSHPRLFLRADEVEALRQAAGGELRGEWEYLKRRAEQAMELVLKTPDEETERWGTVEATAHWRKNYTIARNTVYAGEMLAFCYLVSGEQRYLDGARRILQHLLSWDPRGPSSVFDNDECAMPLLQYIPRMYDWLYDALTEQERREVVEHMRIRGQEARRDLGDVHHKAYDSHAHRMYHQLAEAGIVFFSEIPESEEWIRHALTIYHTWYPAWGDYDGGWSAGLAYYSGYVLMVTNWLDAAECALGLVPEQHPFIRNAGSYAM
ncbi:MAG: DUF4962 domain-containing protein, partial [Candidatus Glassbacteria bacterium]|nr:DUF4962 domain-containing protein [Candidatus Glassbacteria bacterium]